MSCERLLSCIIHLVKYGNNQSIASCECQIRLAYRCMLSSGTRYEEKSPVELALSLAVFLQPFPCVMFLYL